ncbi:hypothetical protein SAMN06295885_0196 [Rathayibacter oskolensis]|uniref:Uncharacterized protein n=1 Tax=Rathayibacter oskolensis TaxID=1891671 RepID=A0A1X7MX45_9MICO|nr:hypothetical protein [Rathayibacter oskolensis]SMH28538.1 hypothetical protein SAMN06295885_0196 [Rathayibacter oskolensis]
MPTTSLRGDSGAPSRAPEYAALPPRTPAALVFDVWQSRAHWDAAGHRTGIDTRIRIRVGAPAATLAVRVRYPASTWVGGRPIALTGAGWSFTTATADLKGAVEYVFTWRGPALGLFEATPELAYTLTATVPGRVQLSATASAPNAGPVVAPSWGDDVY